jgi:hypothetical protein
VEQLPDLADCSTWNNLPASACDITENQMLQPSSRSTQCCRSKAVRSVGSFVVLLLLDIDSASPAYRAASAGRFALAVKLPDIPALLLRAMHIPWLGPGLVLAFLLLVTLRGARRMAYKPLQRKVHQPKLEQYRGVIPRKHQDLEI